MTAHSLSSAVAVKVGIPAFKEYAYYIGSNEAKFAFRQVYLEDDNDRCFKLMCEHNVTVHLSAALGFARCYARGTKDIEEKYSDYPSEAAATRHAILKCILEI